MKKQRRPKVSFIWHDNGEFWLTVDDRRDGILTVMLTPCEALDFLIEANGKAAQLNAEGKLQAA